jgi:hypothetical protein
MKSLKKTAHGDFSDDSVPCHITNLLWAYEQVVASFIICNAFRKVGFTPELTVRPLWLGLSEDIFSANQGSSEICNLIIAMGHISKWQNSNQFVLINANFPAGDPDE